MALKPFTWYELRLDLTDAFKYFKSIQPSIEEVALVFYLEKLYDSYFACDKYYEVDEGQRYFVAAVYHCAHQLDKVEFLQDLYPHCFKNCWLILIYYICIF